MATVPKRVSERLAKGVKKFQPILSTARARDDGEADTVMIITDLLQEVFGYDKYSEITAEFSIRSTFCDLAIKLDGALQNLIEVKAIGMELKDNHVRQAVDYAANQGVDWVILTNGINWRVYKVHFTKPIEQELVVEFDFCQLSSRSEKDIESLYLLCKEGWIKSVLGEYHVQKQALSRFFLGAMLLTDPVIDVVRRELRRLSPDVRIDADELRHALSTEVIKREVTEGDKADEARRKVRHAADRPLRAKVTKKGQGTRTEESDIDDDKPGDAAHS
ncbi:MAG TPA: type I restriction enzyme HsdR N-terminal domain-containing protein [Candidatus Binatia bacterium]|jgi:hypothetical protein|nr:type I restriction enzyme HsdR N-terminal domain-containing protein [Candidatus Binatia bacterium]